LRILLLAFLYFFAWIVFPQEKYEIKGKIKQINSKTVYLKKYNFDSLELISKNLISSEGEFTLNYPSEYVGVAVLEIENTKSVIILLNHENFTLEWRNIEDINELYFTNSRENTLLTEALNLFQEIEKKKSGLHYLLPLYKNEPLKERFFEDEMRFLTDRFENFNNYIKNIPCYAKYYIGYRILYNQLASQNFKDLAEIDNKLNFSSKNLINSGLYFNLIDSIVITIENSTNANNFGQLNHFTERVLNSIDDNESKTIVAEHLYNLFEKRSLFNSSEYLSILMLNEKDCFLSNELRFKFEQYKKMKVGNVAPDVDLNIENKEIRLLDLNARYKLVVFGSSQCQKCIEEIPKLLSYYTAWKKEFDLEIVYISLDTDDISNKNFITNFKWISKCDFNGWNSKDVKNYYVFGTPTFYLLNKSNKIQLKPISVDQINSWLNLNK